MTDYAKLALELHEKHRGKLETRSKIPLKDRDDLSTIYTPGVAAVSSAIAKDQTLAHRYTLKANTVAIVSDGTAVLGLGNIGPYAAIPVMEGKAILFKELAGIDAFPICIQGDKEHLIDRIRSIAPVFGGINLEDIAAPHCFQVEEALQDLGIPVMHDDQWGTAVVVLAALINAAKLRQKPLPQMRIVINGAGAAGIAIARLLLMHEPRADLLLCDSKGAIHRGRTDLNRWKREIAMVTNKDNIPGGLADIITSADLFIGVSKGGLLTKDMVRSMAHSPIIFAMANPEPEIMPQDALDAGASIVGTGRSDFPNQINNVLAFPGIFRAALDCHAKAITTGMKLAAAQALAGYVQSPTADKLLPDPLDRDVHKTVTHAVAQAWKDSG